MSSGSRAKETGEQASGHNGLPRLVLAMVGSVG